MKRFIFTISFIGFILLAALGFVFIAPTAISASAHAVPLSGNVSQAIPSVDPSFPTLEQFVSSHTNGQSGTITGVYIAGALAAPVVQQPSDDPNYISTAQNDITQFHSAAAKGVTGLLAHNFLAGESFKSLQAGQTVILVYGDGRTRGYTIKKQAEFQALNPTSPTSSFKDLQTGKILTSGTLFNQYYTGGDHLTFQTCIEQDGTSSWGRLFVVATPN